MLVPMIGGVVGLGLAVLADGYQPPGNWTRPLHPNLPAIPATTGAPAIVSLPHDVKHQLPTTRVALTGDVLYPNQTAKPPSSYYPPEATASDFTDIPTAGNDYHIGDGKLQTNTSYITFTRTVPANPGATAQVTGVSNNKKGFPLCYGLPDSLAPSESALSPQDSLYSTGLGVVVKQGSSTFESVTTTVTSVRTATATVTLLKAGNESDGISPDATLYGSDLTTLTSTTTFTSTSTLTRSTEVSPTSDINDESDVAADVTSITPPQPGNGDHPATDTPQSTILGPYYQLLGAKSWNFTKSSAESQNLAAESTSSPLPASQGIVRRQVGGTGLPNSIPQVQSPTTNFTKDGFTTRTIPSSSSAIVAASGTPTVCGESGEFKLHFDNLPDYNPPENNSAGSRRTIFNPNKHFFFSSGWFYSPASNALYHPISEPHIAVFDPSKDAAEGSPYAGLERKGGFGAGPRKDQKTFWFDAHSAYIGCDSRSYNTPCKFTAFAAKYSAETKQEEIVTNSTFHLSTCPGDKQCHLTGIKFGPEFRGLSGITFSAHMDDKPVAWYMDDAEMDWYDNSCEAGLERILSR